jgi:hypothetical protein
MTKAVISRRYDTNETLGMLWVVDGIKLLYRCKCLELAWVNNQQKVSCIPEGVYDVVKFNSQAKGKVFLLLNVPGREGIEIHAGNFLRDTLGCILPGNFFTNLDDDEIPDVAESQKAMDCLYDVLPDSFKLYII